MIQGPAIRMDTHADDESDHDEDTEDGNITYEPTLVDIYNYTESMVINNTNLIIVAEYSDCHNVNKSVASMEKGADVNNYCSICLNISDTSLGMSTVLTVTPSQIYNLFYNNFIK